MPWTGGIFSRTNGVNTGASLWQADRDAGTKIRADRHDTHDQDLADGINATIKKDGNNTPTADLPMNTQKHTGVGNADARDQYGVVGQIQDESYTFVGATGVAGTADAITLAPAPAITAYAAGQRFTFVAEGNNTGAVTINVNAVGAQDLQALGTALVGGEIATGDLLEIIYDGTQFQLISPTVAENKANIFTVNQTVQRTGAAPIFTIQRPEIHGDGVAVGVIRGVGQDDLGSSQTYGEYQIVAADDANGAADGQLILRTTWNGTAANRFKVNEGFFSNNATGGDQGADTINASELYEDGNRVAVQAQANTFTATQTISSTDSGSGEGPLLDLFRESSSPAAFDDLASIRFRGKDSVNNNQNYAKINCEIQDPTNGSEDGILRIATIVDGSLTNRFVFGHGFYTQNASGGDQGADTFNASALFVDGNATPMLYGLQLSNGTDADHDIDVTAGQCSDADKDTHITLSAITKRIDATWSSGSGNGGRSSSVSLTADTWYHVHAIVVGGSADVGFDTSVTAANLVTDHSATAYRRLLSVLTDGSANIIGFSQDGDEVLWDVPVNDYNVTNPGTSATLRALSVPTGVQVRALHSFSALDTTPAAVTNVLLTSPDQTDTAPSATVNDFVIANTPNQERGSVHKAIRTDTSARIRTRIDQSTAQTFINGTTFGWYDRRGRDD